MSEDEGDNERCEAKEMNKQQALKFFREYGGGLNPYQRRTYSDGKIRNIAMSKFFDVLSSEVLHGAACRVADNKYEVSHQTYTHLKIAGYLELFPEIDISEVSKTNV